MWPSVEVANTLQQWEIVFDFSSWVPQLSSNLNNVVNNDGY
jgi:hypothetical protein